MTTPKFDIICLVHNKLPITRGFVKSIFAHTSNFQLIFVDNGSTDGTAEFLKKGADDNKWKVVTSQNYTIRGLGRFRDRVDQKLLFIILEDAAYRKPFRSRFDQTGKSPSGRCA